MIFCHYIRQILTYYLSPEEGIVKKEVQLELLVIIPISFIIGVASSFFGIGGGVLAIPTIYMLYPEMPYHSILGTSLLMILFNSIRNTLTFLQRGQKPCLKILLPLILSIFVGVWIGGSFAMNLDGNTLKKILGAYLLISAVKAFIPNKKQIDENHWKHLCEKMQYSKGLFTGLIVGSLSTLTGVGGGAILIPLYIMIYKLPMKLISLYSNSVMFFTSLGGVLIYFFQDIHHFSFVPMPFNSWHFGHVNVALALILFIGGTFTYKIGFWLHSKVSEKTLKYSFATLLLTLSVKILFF